MPTASHLEADDAGPDGVGGADWEGAQRPRERQEADGPGHGEEQTWSEAGEAMTLLERDGHRHLDDAGNEQDEPGHGGAPCGSAAIV